ncbi:MAG: TonB-dependent receptor [Gemmatimonadota bacterium]|nr:TonB-dependent receptor [Gemmatimonadota bacterium]
MRGGLRWRRLAPIALAAGLLTGPGLAAQGTDSDRSRELHVTVVDAHTNDAIVGAVVRVSAAAGTRDHPAAIVGSDGGGVRFLIDRVALHTLTVEALGYGSHQETVEAGSEALHRRVRLRPAPLEVPAVVARVSRGLESATTYSIDRETQALRGRDLETWLRDLPGVGVRRRGPAGRAVATVRGSRPEAVEVTLDGIPLTDPITGTADLSLVSAGTLERVVAEIGADRGTGWGGAAGTLRLESRRGAPGVRLGVGAGSFGRLETDAEFGVGTPTLEAVGSIRYESGRNDFEFRNRVGVGTPVERRVNADYSRWGGLGRVSLRGAPVSLIGRVDGVERGAPGRMGSSLWDQARWRERLALVGVSVGGETRRPGVPTPARISLSWSGREQIYSDARRGVADSLRADQVVFTVAEVLPGHLDMTWRGTWARVSGQAIAQPTTRLAAGVRVSRSFHPVSGLSLDPALGFDVSDVASAVSPSLGAAWRTTETSRIWARAGQGLRLPTFGDLFLRPGTGAVPNPDLRPERVTLDSELGWAWKERDAGADLSATVFYRHTRDPIIWLPSVVAVWRPLNAGKLTAYGIEAHAGVSPWRGWSARATVTLQTSELGFENYANPLPYHPHVSGSVSLERRGAGPDARLDVEVLGPRRTNVFGPHELPTIALIDIRGRQAAHVLGLHTVIELGVSNVLDVSYESVELFPEPGRTFEIRLNVTPGGSGRLQANRSGRSLSPVPEAGGDAVDDTRASGEPDRSSVARW